MMTRGARLGGAQSATHRIELYAASVRSAARAIRRSRTTLQRAPSRFRTDSLVLGRMLLPRFSVDPFRFREDPHVF